jgi:hypothetical protein
VRQTRIGRNEEDGFVCKDSGSRQHEFSDSHGIDTRAAQRVVVRGVWTAPSIHSSVLRKLSTVLSTGQTREGPIHVEDAVIISTGGIANEADGVEPHDAPNRAGRLNQGIRAVLAGPLAGGDPHAEARMKRVRHAEWSAFA